jgi:hypothetical protein
VYDVLDNPTALTVCELPAQVCNPVGTADCGHPELACYVSSTNQTVCDCRGTAQSGQPCTLFNSCIPGFRCVSVGLAAPVCLKTCTFGVPGECPAGNCTNAGGGAFGYCPP